MRPSPFVTEATRENFNRLVLGNADKGPVMVHFWDAQGGVMHVAQSAFDKAHYRIRR